MCKKSKDKITKLLSEFVGWVEQEYEIDISDCDQDTTPAAVWRYLSTGELD